MSWPKKKSAQSSSTLEEQQKKELSIPTIVTLMLAAIVGIGIGLWLMVG
ncbi:hypothetical protein [Arthrobacter bambusae]|uniref:Uncharacterized protein n=1 Tax=Arthrobacter bambusae TaxID=1338426 RepID=A0AAW8DDZ8_9MICC|nr:hypothetical protein [Arthrobacter bambusae]MDP9904738.1 hypothetical protein [Arthrobacter bambusae]MDQ0129554.1 hypothetical protein [Arthrobacter bambusae]MDQ0180833.1 hypothetical protein [Arthrobacter bambusae]